MEATAGAHHLVNNDIYSTLGDRWYEADDDPVALLRAESRLRNPWVLARVRRSFGDARVRVLDIGCGGGFLSNYLAGAGHEVTGVDQAADALSVAARHDATRTARYEQADALRLPYANGSFDVVCAMDFLEHVEEPERAIAEAARVLSAGGLFFFHTFDRSLLAWLVVIKGVEWCVRNTPKDMHVLRLFLKPSEVVAMCERHGLSDVELRGARPVLDAELLKMLFTGKVSKDFSFTFSTSTRIAYSGCATRRP